MRSDLSMEVIDSPVGPMMAVASERGLVALEFHSPRGGEMLHRRLRRWYGGAAPRPGTSAPIEAARRWMERYFRGEIAIPAAVPLDVRGTPFERRIWSALEEIPPGALLTYHDLAARAGVPGSARVVGGAVGRNPVALIVPCHRVIGRSGSLTGYGGGLPAKEWLLEHERRMGLSLPLTRPEAIFFGA